jgi:hypothetical protein
MNLVKWLFGQTCSHRFAWPRNDGTGSHYQTCLVCGTAYEYDWMNMRRTKRLAAHDVQRHYAGDTLPGMLRDVLLAARGSAADQISSAHS